MTEPLFERSQLVWSGDRKVGVRVKPGVFKNAQRICEYLRGDIRITGQWHIQKPPPVLVLHLVCNGAGPTLFLTAFKESSTANHFYELARLHKSFLDGNHCLVVAMGEDTELFLAPVNSPPTSSSSDPRNSDELLFWGYAAMRGAVAHVTEMLDTGRIPLVFDLDETLVLAHTIFSLRAQQTQLEADIGDLQNNPDTKERMEVLQQEQKTVNEDVDQLKMFTEMDRIIVDDETIHAQHEFAEHDGQLFLRPVIRTGGKIFTRIDPLRKDTSMLIRIREGWEELSKYLRGEGTSDRRQRFKIWVCTAAERGYAIEAWRLLDTSSELIPKKEIKSRLICSGKQKKSLFKTFNIGPLHGESIPPEVLVPGKKLGPLSEGFSEMAMAIIADDRLEVWEKRNQDQILQITPFNYNDVKRKKRKDDGEIRRMLTIFQSVRSSFYFEMLEVLGPLVDAEIKKGFQNDLEVQQFQEMIKNGASIVAYLTAPLSDQVIPTTMPSAIPSQPPVQKPEVLLKPTDPRPASELNKSRQLQPQAKRKNSKPVPEDFKRKKEAKGIKRSAQSMSNAESDHETQDIVQEESFPVVAKDSVEPTAVSSELPTPPTAPVEEAETKLLQENQTLDNSVASPVSTVQSTDCPVFNFSATEVTGRHLQPLPSPSMSPVLHQGGLVSPTLMQMENSVQPVYSIPSRPTLMTPGANIQPQNGLTTMLRAPVHQQQQQSLINVGQAAGQIRVLPGSMMLTQNPQTQPAVDKYSIIQLPDGRHVLQQVITSVQQQQQSPSSLEANNPQPFKYSGIVVHQHSQNVNQGSIPTLQLQQLQHQQQPTQQQQWMTSWIQQPKHYQMPSQTALGGPSLMLGGTFQRQLNLPGSVQVLSHQSRNLQNSMQPHQLELPQVAVVQSTGKSPDQANLSQQKIVVLPTSQNLVLPAVAQNPALRQEQDNFAKTMTQQTQEQQMLFPVANMKPPPPPPVAPAQQQQQFTARSTERLPAKAKQRQMHSMQTRSGGPGKIIKRANAGDCGRIQKTMKNPRETQNNRRLTRNAHVQSKNMTGWQANKKQKRVKTNAETQDFNLSGYMAQLADELDEQEASEEGEIRE